MLPILHFRQTDASESGSYADAVTQERPIPGRSRPTDDSIRGQRMIQVTMIVVSFSSVPGVSGHTTRRAQGALLPRPGLHFREGDPSSSWGRSLEKAEARSPPGAATAPQRCLRHRRRKMETRINVASS